MKRTFRLMGLALLAASLTFTACDPKDDPINVEDEIVDDQNPGEGPDNPGEDPETTGATFDFDGAVTWTPQSVHGLYYFEDDTPYIIFVATRDQTTIEDVYAYLDGQGFDGGDVPEGWLMGGFYAVAGSHSAEGSLFTEESDEGLLFFTGTAELLGAPMPTGWASTDISINVTDINVATNSISATVSATMQDMWFILSEGTMGTSGEKTFTIAFNNFSIVNIDYKGYSKKMQMIRK